MASRRRDAVSCAQVLARLRHESRRRPISLFLQSGRRAAVTRRRCFIASFDEQYALSRYSDISSRSSFDGRCEKVGRRCSSRLHSLDENTTLPPYYILPGVAGGRRQFRAAIFAALFSFSCPKSVGSVFGDSRNRPTKIEVIIDAGSNDIARNSRTDGRTRPDLVFFNQVAERLRD